MASFVPAESRPGQPSVDPDLQDVAHFVHEEFDGRLDPHAVDQCLCQVALRYDGASVRSFVPLLVGLYAREELQQRLRQARQVS